MLSHLEDEPLSLVCYLKGIFYGRECLIEACVHDRADDLRDGAFGHMECENNTRLCKFGKKDLADFPHSFAAVTYPVSLGDTRFRKCLCDTVCIEKRSVAKTLISPPLVQNTPAALTCSRSHDIGLRIVQCRYGLEYGRTFLFGHLGKLLQEPLVARFVALAIACRLHPRSTLECSNLKAGVLRKRQEAGTETIDLRFEDCIFLERIFLFLGLLAGFHLRECPHLEWHVTKQLEYFAQLPLVACRYQKLTHGQLR